jgi:hypothetical protein
MVSFKQGRGSVLIPLYMSWAAGKLLNVIFASFKIPRVLCVAVLLCEHAVAQSISMSAWSNNLVPNVQLRLHWQIVLLTMESNCPGVKLMPDCLGIAL